MREMMGRPVLVIVVTLSLMATMCCCTLNVLVLARLGG